MEWKEREGKGREGKGKERNGMELKHTTSPDLAAKELKKGIVAKQKTRCSGKTLYCSRVVVLQIHKPQCRS